MAAPHGFEPWITEPESVVLPVTLRGNALISLIIARFFGVGKLFLIAAF